ncbi:MAG: hypothetical protein K8U57_34200 [Planctomycetes bacterium]|nr:hypothetical protein [Planctomycetota bacterium]
MSTGDIDPTSYLVCSRTAPTVEAARFDAAWRTSTVLALAAGIARDGTFDVLPILADALEDADCDNRLLLVHCLVSYDR